MTAKVSFFRVGNGDMALLTLESGRRVLIDCRIRSAADDQDDDTPDVASQLKDRLKIDQEGRPYVDAMLLSHPDADHCLGLQNHFHLGSIDDYSKGSGKIVIREMWSSPIVFRRASGQHTLCADAKAWAKEARRRVQQFRDKGHCATNERILILGEDVDGKTDDLLSIVVKTGEDWNHVNGEADGTFSALLIAPLSSDDDDEEETLTKNDSSVIARIKIRANGAADACRLLTGGDAGVAIWERVWEEHQDTAIEDLGYDLLLTPHHCSWRSLSWDSWSDCGEEAEVSETALKALSQGRKGAKLVASCKPISEDDSDPPCIRAEREYKSIADNVDGEFICLGDDGPDPLEYEIDAGGLKKRAKAASMGVLIRQPLGHG